MPEVTPAPAAGRVHPGAPGAGTGTSTLTADAGVIGSGQGRMIVLGITLAAGLGAVGAWLAMAGPARRALLSLGHRRVSLPHRRGRHTR